MIINALESVIGFIKPLCVRAYVIISFALWLPALYAAGKLSEGKTKAKRILIFICLIMLFCFWFIGQDEYYNQARNSTNYVESTYMDDVQTHF